MSLYIVMGEKTYLLINGGLVCESCITGGGGIDVYEVLIRLYFLFCLFPLYANLTSGIIIVQSLFCTNLGCYL